MPALSHSWAATSSGRRTPAQQEPSDHPPEYAPLLPGPPFARTQPHDWLAPRLDPFDLSLLDDFVHSERSAGGPPTPTPTPTAPPTPAQDATSAPSRALRYRRNLARFEGQGPASAGRSPLPGYGAARDEPARKRQSQRTDGHAPAPQRAGADGLRFSLTTLTAGNTRYARQLSELPLEGQTFEQLLYDWPFTPDHHARGMGQEGGAGAAAARTECKCGSLHPSLSPPTSAPPSPSGGTWWLDVLSPTPAEMKVLAKGFGLHPLTTEDILTEETREKIELFRHYYLVSFRSFDHDPFSSTYLQPLNMYIVVFRRGTLSFHFRPTSHTSHVRHRIEQLRDYLEVSSDWISYALMDDITDAFAPLIQGIEYDVDAIDDLVLILKEADQSDMLRRIGGCRKKVMGLLRLLGSKADVVKGLAKRCSEAEGSVAPKTDMGLYLSDIQDHLITMVANLNHYEKILSRAHSNYLAQISIEMTDANNQINDVLSKLTALGTVIVPLNIVTGMWGMNVKVRQQPHPRPLCRPLRGDCGGRGAASLLSAPRAAEC